MKFANPDNVFWDAELTQTVPLLKNVEAESVFPLTVTPITTVTQEKYVKIIIVSMDVEMTMIVPVIKFVKTKTAKTDVDKTMIVTPIKFAKTTPAKPDADRTITVIPTKSVSMKPVNKDAETMEIVTQDKSVLATLAKSAVAIQETATPENNV